MQISSDSIEQIFALEDLIKYMIPEGTALSILNSSVQDIGKSNVSWASMKAMTEKKTQVNRAKFLAALVKYGPWAAGVAAVAIGASLGVQMMLEKTIDV